MIIIRNKYISASLRMPLFKLVGDSEARYFGSNAVVDGIVFFFFLLYSYCVTTRNATPKFHQTLMAGTAFTFLVKLLHRLAGGAESRL